VPPAPVPPEPAPPEAPPFDPAPLDPGLPADAPPPPFPLVVVPAVPAVVPALPELSPPLPVAPPTLGTEPPVAAPGAVPSPPHATSMKAAVSVQASRRRVDASNIAWIDAWPETAVSRFVGSEW